MNQNFVKTENLCTNLKLCHLKAKSIFGIQFPRFEPLQRQENIKSVKKLTEDI